MSPSTTSQVTTDHEEIRRWAEARGAKPAAVARTESDADPGIIRLEFPGAPDTKEQALEKISWDDWFEKFEERGLALLYQEETAGGEKSNFNKIISRETAEGVNESVGGKGRSALQKRGGKSLGSGAQSLARESPASRARERESNRGEGREETTRKPTSVREHSSTTGRASTRSRASEKQSGTSRMSSTSSGTRTPRGRSAGETEQTAGSGSSSTAARKSIRNSKSKTGRGR